MRKFLMMLPLLALSVLASAQDRPISGTVVRQKNKEPLQGVSVTNGSRSVVSDSLGRFTIPGHTGQSITVTFVGMNMITRKITGDNNMDFEMVEGESDLNQVVVTGYKSEKKVDLTGAVSVVNLTTVKNMPVASPMLALQGQVPGLYITGDGSPTGNNGSGPGILIRGVNTLGNTNPLYIIDGVPTTRYEVFGNLNTNAIASIQVLKDASAASIYGSRASNGVIIVTTKDGANPGGKFHINVSSSITSQTERPWQEPVLNSNDRGRALWQAAVNDSTDPNNLMPQIYTFDWNNNYANPQLNKVNIAPFVGGDSLEPVGNTNWQNALYRNAIVTSNDISISSGDARSGMLMDFGYYNNDGLIAFTKYRRYSGRINSHSSAFDGRLKFGENLQISQTSQVLAANDPGGARSPTLAMILAPTIPLYKTDGSYGGPIGPGYTDRNNPVDVQYLHRWNTNNQFIAFGNAYAQLEIIKNLNLRSSFGFEYSDSLGKYASLIGQEGPVQSFNSLSLQNAKEFAFTWTNTLNYNLEFGLNRLNILLGEETVRDNYNTFGAQTTNFAVQDINYFQLSAGTGSQTNNGSATGYRLASQFGKLFYGYADRYLASVTVRRDGSSRFGSNNPYGIFPAFTLGWRINNEEFFKKITAVSNLKLRGGIGTVGNQQIDNLSAYTLFKPNYGTSSPLQPQWLNNGTAYDLTGVNTGTLPSGFVQTQLGNPNLKWESTTETNIGLDFGFFHEKITGSFDYFTRSTSNILILPPVAGAVGEGQLQWVNGASIRNKGWELALGYHDQSANGKFAYTIAATASHFSNVITALPEAVRAAYPGDPNHSIIGHSQYSVFGYKTDGIFQSQQEVANHAVQPGAGPGRLKYEDLNGDGVVDALDQTWLGTTLPKLEYGLRVDLTYAGFDLSLSGSGVAGKTAYDPTKNFNTIIRANTNAGPGVFNTWRPDNTSSKLASLTILDRNNEGRTSNYYFVNASYFKLRNLLIGYNLPRTISSRLKLEGLRIYVSGQNLFALKAKDFTAKDPERASSFDYWPVPTSYTFGINATL